MARHEVPKPVKQKKAAPRKRAKVAALIAPPEVVEAHRETIVLNIEELQKSLQPAGVPEENLPVIAAAFYAPDAEPVEPHHVVLEVAGKKSLYRRFCDWMEA